MTDWHRELAAVLARCRELLAAPDSDYTWSSWVDAADALAEIDLMALQVDCGAVPAPWGLPSVFLPTGPLQEVALSSGWGDEFRMLAADRAVFACCLCGAVAGKIELSGRRSVRIRREGQTSVMHAPVPRKAAAGLRAALGRGDLPAIFAVDLEYLPNWCPECGLTYCVAHWVRWRVFDDDGWHDSIRGRCPHGHERMLED